MFSMIIKHCCMLLDEALCPTEQPVTRSRSRKKRTRQNKKKRTGSNDEDPDPDGPIHPPSAKKLPYPRTLAEAQSILSPYGTHECENFRQSILSRHQTMLADLTRGYLLIAEKEGHAAANRRLLEADEELIRGDLNLSADKSTIHTFCKKRARECEAIASRHKDDKKAYERLIKIPRSYGINPPAPKAGHDDFMPCIKRLSCTKWWRSRVFRLQARVLESRRRDLGMVCHTRASYASGYAVEQQRQKLEALHAFLEATFIENDSGERFSLKDLYDRSIANKNIRRAEMMVRIKGFEQHAIQLGHCGDFYTLTTPSRMHAFRKDGTRNPKFDGTTPDEAHRYLTNLFCLIRAKLSRKNIPFYGIRVVEPHHDGTPHWHLLVFIPPEHLFEVRRIFRDYALRTDPEERGANEYRFKAKRIDPARGDAIGYIAKYIAKNINTNDASDSKSERGGLAAEAWARIYGIRQFQFFGGPSVTVWRELRRYARQERSTSSLMLLTASEAATASDWARYMEIMGGPCLPSDQRPIRPLRQPYTPIDLDTGEIDPEAVNSYGETKAPKLIGLLVEGIERVITRLRTWKVVPRSEVERSNLAGVGAL